MKFYLCENQYTLNLSSMLLCNVAVRLQV